MPESTNHVLDTRASILCTAEALFIEHGYAATSLRLITAKAKVNLAALNYHFGSKQALIREYPRFGNDKRKPLVTCP